MGRLQSFVISTGAKLVALALLLVLLRLSPTTGHWRVLPEESMEKSGLPVNSVPLPHFGMQIVYSQMHQMFPLQASTCATGALAASLPTNLVTTQRQWSGDCAYSRILGCVNLPSRIGLKEMGTMLETLDVRSVKKHLILQV